VAATPAGVPSGSAAAAVPGMSPRAVGSHTPLLPTAVLRGSTADTPLSLGTAIGRTPAHGLLGSRVREEAPTTGEGAGKG
jgi:hypothetical protein